eukprot:TRINITY_DN9109_c0_g4_i1.p1 TRINITY_DN9109_c0_g4~~TRINITY_DN9109_c0_g4_i1.p1  ORF type:complete len:1011 (+),score=295.35 TRINITY_DN9109_c0_g4_i1:2645-5677(+)
MLTLDDLCELLAQPPRDDESHQAVLRRDPSLPGGELSEDDLRRLTSALSSHGRVTRLSVQGYRLSVASALVLGQFVKCSRALRYLDFSHSRMGSDAAVQIVAALSPRSGGGRSKVQTLDLSGCHIGVRAVPHIARSLESVSSHLRSLQLRYNPITAQGLGLLLKWAIGLSTLDCRYCGILSCEDASARRTGIAFIEEGLRENTALSTLLLQGNGFTAEEEECILQIVAENRRSAIRLVQFTDAKTEMRRGELKVLPEMMRRGDIEGTRRAAAAGLTTDANARDAADWELSDNEDAEHSASLLEDVAVLEGAVPGAGPSGLSVVPSASRGAAPTPPEQSPASAPIAPPEQPHPRVAQMSAAWQALMEDKATAAALAAAASVDEQPQQQQQQRHGTPEQQRSSSPATDRPSTPQPRPRSSSPPLPVPPPAPDVSVSASPSSAADSRPPEPDARPEPDGGARTTGRALPGGRLEVTEDGFMRRRRQRSADDRLPQCSGTPEPPPRSVPTPPTEPETAPPAPAKPHKRGAGLSGLPRVERGQETVRVTQEVTTVRVTETRTGREEVSSVSSYQSRATSAPPRRGRVGSLSPQLPARRQSQPEPRSRSAGRRAYSAVMPEPAAPPEPAPRLDRATPAVLNACMSGDAACRALLGDEAFAALPPEAGRHYRVPQALVACCGMPTILNHLRLGSEERVFGIAKLLWVLTHVARRPGGSDDEVCAHAHAVSARCGDVNYSALRHREDFDAVRREENRRARNLLKSLRPVKDRRAPAAPAVSDTASSQASAPLFRSRQPRPAVPREPVYRRARSLPGVARASDTDSVETPQYMRRTCGSSARVASSSAAPAERISQSPQTARRAWIPPGASSNPPSAGRLWSPSPGAADRSERRWHRAREAGDTQREPWKAETAQHYGADAGAGRQSRRPSGGDPRPTAAAVQRPHRRAQSLSSIAVRGGHRRDDVQTYVTAWRSSQPAAQQQQPTAAELLARVYSNRPPQRQPSPARHQARVASYSAR